MISEILPALNAIKATSQTYGRGLSIYRQGDISNDYFVVADGWIALSVALEDGARHILDFALPGAFLGLQPTSGAALSHSAQCVTSAKVYCFSRHQIDEIVEREPKLAGLLLSEASAQAARANDHLVNVACREARERVSHLLVELFGRVHGRLPRTTGESFFLPLTLQQIGDATGFTDVHVSRTLRILRSDQIISLKSGVLTVLNPENLKAAAGFDDQKISAALRIAVAANDQRGSVAPNPNIRLTRDG